MPSSLDNKLSKLASLARDLPSQSARDEFKKALLGANNVLIARAAQLVGRRGDRELAPVLAEAFDRLLGMPPAADKGCRAKSAILEALDALKYDDVEPFLAGIVYRQMEPVYGGQVDTAADLRATCAIMLARRYYPDLYFAIVPLLVDPEPSPRLAAVSVLAGLGSETGELLLMLKALTPEQDPMVLRKCFSGLLAMNTDRSWTFVAGFLRSADLDLAESAAIAIGETHDERAFPALREALEANTSLEFTSTLLLAMALSRTDQAIDYLVAMITGESTGAAVKAIEAMSIYSADERLRQRVHEAAASRPDPRVLEAYQARFQE